MVAFPPQPLLLAPFFSPRPWGGRKLAGVLHKGAAVSAGDASGQTLDPFIGEAWELSDHPDGLSRIASGTFAGMTFSELLHSHPREMCGLSEPPPRYPLLIKYIDAAEDLSIQVHPNDAQAALHGERGKSECWLIMDCAPGATLIHGLAPGVDAAMLARGIDHGDLEACLRRVPIRRGDFILVPHGTVHAILGGTLLCEVQQSSNATYRLWDWNRLPARPLHVEQSLSVARYDMANEPAPLVHTDVLALGVWHPLAHNEYFAVAFRRQAAGRAAAFERNNAHGLVLNVVQGSGRLQWDGQNAPLKLGETWYLTPGMEAWSTEAGTEGLGLLLSESLEF